MRGRYVELFERNHLYNTPSQLRKMLKDLCLRPEKIRLRDIRRDVDHFRQYLWENQKKNWDNVIYNNLMAYNVHYNSILRGKRKLRSGESNPGRPRDRRKY